MQDLTYMQGAGMRWGIWNSVQKEFQFDINEPSPMLAEARLAYIIGRDSYKNRFQAKVLPKIIKDSTLN